MGFRSSVTLKDFADVALLLKTSRSSLPNSSLPQLGSGHPGHWFADAAVARGDQPAGYHQHRHHRPRGPRQKYCRQGPLRSAHRQVSSVIKEKILNISITGL